MIQVGKQPVRISWAEFPLTAGGVVVRRGELEGRIELGLGNDLLKVLEKYQLTQYQMHLDGFEPEQQNRTELEKILFEFPSLIRNNKAVQAISGTGLGLILVILVMILVCCLCSARCRGCARRMCCCCSAQEAKEAVDGLRHRINQERENFQEYQLIRKEARNPERSAPAFEQYRDRLTQQMSRREREARAPIEISEA